jgi:hypothetical protein
VILIEIGADSNPPGNQWRASPVFM